MNTVALMFIIVGVAVGIYLLMRMCGYPAKKIELFESFENFVDTLTDSNFKNIEKIKSDADSTEYTVQSEFKDKKEAAELLAELNNIVRKFLDELKRQFPQDQRVQRLVRKYPGTEDILEGNPVNDSNSTAYSVAKGEKLVICLRSKDDKKLLDKNVIMFVILHELSHIMSETYGHNAEFNENFKFLLKQAMKSGIYKYINFSVTPKKYCGMMITNSVI
jgi:hypothetical protein